MRQVVGGGNLDTVLLEMDAVPEDRLTQYLSLATGLPPASKNESDVFDAEAIKRCPQDVAEKYRVAPLSLNDSVLQILVCEPVNLSALEELANVIGVGLHPLVVPEYRFHVIFSRIFGTESSERFVSLSERQQGITFAVTGGAAPVILESSTAADHVVVDTPLEQVPPPASEPPRATEEPSATTEESPEAAAFDAEETVTDGAPVEPVEAEATQRTPAQELEPHGPPALSVKDARAALEESTDRDEIFEILLRGLRSMTRYSALLTVKGKKAVGRRSLHDGSFTEDGVDSLQIPLEQPSPYTNTKTSGAPFIGPLATGDAELDALTAKLGGELPAVGLILPVSLRGRVVALAVAHSGASNRWIGRASGMFTLATDTADAIERLLLAKSKKKDADPAGDEEPTKSSKKSAKGKGRGKKKRKRSKSGTTGAET